jgi:riboflavin kinase / FMN adenylyltransferase
VVVGDQRGRTLGYPTANLKVQPEQAMPKDGIYVTLAHRPDGLYHSVTNIGVRPTFDGFKHLIETYIMDFKGNIYRKKLKIDLVARLRDEMRFKGTEELKGQMKIDVQKAREMLKTL